MIRSVLCFSLLCLSVISTHGRIALSDVSHQIDKNAIESAHPGSKPTVIYLNVSDIIDREALSKAIAEINAYPPTTSRRPCSHKDVKDNEIDADDFEPCEPVTKVDNGSALILTPFVEEGRIEDGRKASEVDPGLFLGVKSHSGFFTVNKTYDSNIFFWYFPVEKKPVNETPWIIWLQGGPGASSMEGLFHEIGPFRVYRGKLDRNPYTWLQNHSLVFLENPVGTGYSFTNHEDGFVRDMATYSKHLYSTLLQFLKLFPELRTAPLFLAGESYAGKYVPALGMEIHKHSHLAGRDINLKGLMIGNAYVDPSTLTSVPTTFFNFGLLNREQMEIINPLNDAFRREIEANRSEDARQKWHELILSLLMLSHQKQAYNFLRDELVLATYTKFLQRSEVKRALHVGDIKHSFVNVTVNTEMAPDFLSSTSKMFEELLNHYQVLAYCGQLDMMLSCPVTSEHYRTWRWDRYLEFHSSPRLPYIYRSRLAGYHKSGGRFTEVLVRGAGHMAPQDAPGAMLRLVSRWTLALPLDTTPDYDSGRVREFVRNATIDYNATTNLYL